MIRHRIASATSIRPHRTRRIARVSVESLEIRALLSTIDTLGMVQPAVASVIAAQGWSSSGGSVTGAVTNPNPIASALTPSDILTAYGFNSSPNAGAGTTIAIVDAYHNPNIQSDLALFNAYYGLPEADLTVVNQRGKTTGMPATSPDWSLEIALDVQWAHVIAPAAKIVLVEASSASVTDLMAAVRTASKMADVVSMSWGAGEWAGQRVYDSASNFAKSNVTFVAASGDDGGANGASWPAASPYVLSVGGTTLSVTDSGAYNGETAWSASGSPWTGYSGSGGGVSHYERLPSYQSSALGSRYASGRVVPDVSMDADPYSGVSIYSSVPGLSQSGWFQIGGTSAGAPIWAGLIATADQARAANGLSALSSTQTLNMLYGLYGTTASNAATYATDFHDVTSGFNFAGNATIGYDRVTGLGSPVANTIVSAASVFNATGKATTTAAEVRELVSVQLTVQSQFASQTIIIVARGKSTVVVFVSAVPINIAPLPDASHAAVAHTTYGATDAVEFDAPGRGLPNQMLTGTNTASVLSSVGEDVAGVYNFCDVPPVSSASPRAVPDHGDFLAPPILNPTTPIGAWDEALASLSSDDSEVLTEPRPMFPSSVVEDVEDELSNASPCLLGAASVALVFWMTWNRRLSERDDDRRFRPAFIPEPSDN